MRRREFLQIAAGAAVAGGLTNNKSLKASPYLSQTAHAVFHVSSFGDDSNPGTEKSPFATLFAAQQAARRNKKSAGVTILVYEGTYYLNTPLSVAPEDSGSEQAPTIYAAAPGEHVTISGGHRLVCHWKAYRDGILMAEVSPGLEFTQLFVNGKRQIRARYPNFDPSNPGKSGYIQAAGSISAGNVSPYAGPNDDMAYSAQAPRGVHFDPATFSKKKWSHPEDAEIHIFQASYWGNLQWKIKAIDFSTNSIWFGDGGQQIGAKWSPHPAAVNEKSRFFVENVFEELDAPGEWFLDRNQSILYYYPELGVQPANGFNRSTLARTCDQIQRHANRSRGTRVIPGVPRCSHSKHLPYNL